MDIAWINEGSIAFTEDGNTAWINSGSVFLKSATVVVVVPSVSTGRKNRMLMGVGL